MAVGKRWIVKRSFEGLPKHEDFEIVSEELPAIQDGEILVSAQYLSVDPYMRPFTNGMTPPFTMIGEAVFKVLESKDENFPVGATILSKAGWILTGIIKSRKMKAEDPNSISIAPDIKELSPSLLLGACGMPGNTAYFGLLEICKPKSGETVVVNGAAGAVGSLVGQLAKLAGCHVIGFAGSDEKCQYLINELSFDNAYNYKKVKVEDAMKDGAPNGVDCFFDNVGGPDSSVIINHMNQFGRIAICGAISAYNSKNANLVPPTNFSFIVKQLKMEGFMVYRWYDRWNEGISYMANLIQEEKLKIKETVVDGFEKMPEAFIGLFNGSNTGKMVVKIT